MLLQNNHDSRICRRVVVKRDGRESDRDKIGWDGLVGMDEMESKRTGWDKMEWNQKGGTDAMVERQAGCRHVRAGTSDRPHLGLYAKAGAALWQGCFKRRIRSSKS